MFQTQEMSKFLQGPCSIGLPNNLYKNYLMCSVELGVSGLTQFQLLFGKSLRYFLTIEGRQHSNAFCPAQYTFVCRPQSTLKES